MVSDGTLTPEALAARASANGVELWALTDHDEIGGQQRAIALRCDGLGIYQVQSPRDVRIKRFDERLKCKRLGQTRQLVAAVGRDRESIDALVAKRSEDCGVLWSGQWMLWHGLPTVPLA